MPGPLAELEALAKMRQESLCALREQLGVQDLTAVQTFRAVIGDDPRITLESVAQELPQLQVLQLDGSNLSRVQSQPEQPLTAMASASYTLAASLTVLAVSCCCLQSLEGLQLLGQLRELYAAHNLVSDLAPLQGLGRLCLLDLQENAVADLDMLLYLAGCSNLASIKLCGNPCWSSSSRQHVQKVQQVLPQIHYLDGISIQETTSSSAQDDSSVDGAAVGAVQVAAATATTATAEAAAAAATTTQTRWPLIQGPRSSLQLQEQQQQQHQQQPHTMSVDHRCLSGGRSRCGSSSNSGGSRPGSARSLPSLQLSTTVVAATDSVAGQASLGTGISSVRSSCSRGGSRSSLPPTDSNVLSRTNSSGSSTSSSSSSSRSSSSHGRLQQQRQQPLTSSSTCAAVFAASPSATGDGSGTGLYWRKLRLTHLDLAGLRAAPTPAAPTPPTPAAGAAGAAAAAAGAGDGGMHGAVHVRDTQFPVPASKHGRSTATAAPTVAGSQTAVDCCEGFVAAVEGDSGGSILTCTGGWSLGGNAVVALLRGKHHRQLAAATSSAGTGLGTG